MQGMMIQDFATAPKASGAPVVPKQQELSEQSFGKMLGAETDQPDAQVESDQPESVEVFSAEGSDTAATPFFMAALFDQSASYVQPSQQNSLIAAAERTQELIAAWLQPQQEIVEGLEDLEVLAGLEGIVTAALEVLDQVSAAPSQTVETQAEAVSPNSLPTLDDSEIAELRALMAVMMQSGQAPKSFEGHPLAAELQKQLDLVQPFVTENGGKGRLSQGLAPEAAQVSSKPEGEAGLEIPLMGSEKAADLNAGLQESQVAKLLSPRQERMAVIAQVAPDKQTAQVAQVAQAVNAIEGEVSLDVVKPDVAAFNGDIQAQQGTSVAGIAQRIVPQTEIVAPRIMQLPSGQQLAESQLVDQVVTHLAGSRDGQTGRMSLRLQPAELGSVRLDLIMDGDRLRAHLQAQTQQVQEVLDRHLPQLKEALQQQGLKIDEFRVDVQTEQDQAEQKFAWQRQQEGHSAQDSWQDNDWSQAEMEIPLQQLMQNVDGGISLRV